MSDWPNWTNTGAAPVAFRACNCFVLTATASSWVFQPPQHGPDCPMTPSGERFLWQRIRRLEEQLKELAKAAEET